MSLKVTEQDRRRVRGTALVFCIIFIVCAALAGLFIGIMPRTEQIKAIGANNEEITAFIGTHDGNTYLVQSKNLLCEYDSFTDEKVLEFRLTEEIKKTIANEDDKVVSYNQWGVSAFSIDNSKIGQAGNDYFIVRDSNGNLFKLKKNAQGKLEVMDDYCLVSVRTDGTYSPKTIKGMDNIGKRLFSLIVEDNFFYIEEYDMENLSQGAVNRKFLWDIGTLEEDGYQQIEAVKSSTGVLAFYAHDNHLIFIKKGGGILRISTDLIDAKNEDGEPIDFFADAASESGIPEDIQAEYDRVYQETYDAYIISRLADWCVKYVIENGKSFTILGTPVVFEMEEQELAALKASFKNDPSKRTEFVKQTESLFEGYTSEQLLAIFSENPMAAKLNDEKILAANIAKEEADKLLSDAEWFRKYDASKMNMFIREDLFDKTYYSSYIPGESTINGMIYSKENEALYYTNASDGYLYVLTRADLEAAERGAFVSSLSTKIDTIHCGKGQTFSDFGNGVGYNLYANTLYLKFANERQLTIVDLNVKDVKNSSEYKVISSFTGSFDMFTVSGDKDNSVTHVMHQVTKVDKKGVDHNYLYVCSYNPERFENKNVITVLFVVFLALAIVTFFFSVWLLLNLRTDKGVKKIVFIAKDSKKNKFVYLSLVFFIAMLIMFCYYEAIGAIAMSFFDYTREKPAWIWNNFANYVKIFNDQYFLPSIFNMLFFLVADIFLCIVPPIIFAILLILIRNKTTSNWIRSLMFIPGIIPSIAGMLIWRVGIYGDDGLLNQIRGAFGMQPINWLLNKDYARWSLIFMGFPFVGGYLIFYGGMMNIPTEYHEAGKLEGLGIIKRFIKIDIPLIMPQIKYIFITTFIASVQNFARTHILKSTVVTTPVQTMYTMMTEQANYGMSSAYATLIFIFLFVAIATNFKMQKQDAMGADL